ncbi:MAG: zinc ribbon domain-containing protein [Candidatus Sumerlaeia bacterium]
MPTYDYLCRACQHEFEVFHGITEKPPVVCPACGDPNTERLLTGGAGLIFKGSGFYITDYRNPSGRKNSNGESRSHSAAGGEQKSSASESGAGDKGGTQTSQAASASPPTGC